MRKLALGILIAIFITSVAAAQCGGGRLGHWGGMARAVAAEGTTIYAAIGSDLVRLDAFYPARPFEVGRIHLSAPCYKLRVSDDGRIAVMASSGDGLLIVDISDWNNPVMLGQFPEIGGYSLAIDGQYAYVGGFQSDFWIVDLEGPTPQIVGHLVAEQGYGSLAARNGYVYAGVQSGTIVIDVTNPAVPVIVGSFGPGLPALAIQGSVLGVAASGYLRLFDIGDGAHPTLLGSAGVPGVSLLPDLALTPNYAFVAGSGGMLSTVTIHDPTRPEYVNVAGHHGGDWDLAASNNFAVVAASGAGIVVLDPRAGEIGGYDGACAGSTLVVRGDLAFVGDGSSAVRVVDISDALMPRAIGSYGSGASYDYLNDIALAGSRAFAAFDATGVHILSIADPTRPRRVGGIDERVQRLFIDGQLLYAIIREGGVDANTVAIYNNLDSEPQLLATIPFPAERRAVSLYAADSRLLVGDRTGVQLFDMSDPGNPELIFDRDNIGSVSGTWLVDSSIIFALSGAGSGQVLDVNQPTRTIGYFHSNYRSRIAIRGNRMILSGQRPPQVFDISDLRSITPIRDVRQYSNAAYPSYALLTEDSLVVASTMDGIVLYQPGGAGDIDRDGVVGLGDLAILLGHFGEPAANGPSGGDLDCDGFVSLEDLLLLLNGWGM